MVEVVEPGPVSCNESLNLYNVAQLEYALEQDKSAIHFESTPSLGFEYDYDNRRMSSSANSTADTESSVASNPRGAKRPLTPDDSPPPVKKRSTDGAWAPSTEASPKLHLPSISSTFYDPARRASLPTLSDSSSASSPSARLRQPSAYNSSPLASSDLNSYTFPPQPSPAPPSVGGNPDSRRPSVSTNLPSYNYSQSPYPTSNPGLTASTGATPVSGSHFSFNSPLPSAAADQYHRSSAAYPSGGPGGAGSAGDPGPEAWGTAASHIVRPSSTPGHLSSPGSSSLKYQDAMRHASFSNSSPMSSHSSSSHHQQHPGGGQGQGHPGQQGNPHHVPLYPASTRISGHSVLDRRGSQYDVPPIKTDPQWSFGGDEYLSSSSSAHPSSYSSHPHSHHNPHHQQSPHHIGLPPSSGLTISSNISPRSASGGGIGGVGAPPASVPPKKRGKLPKETTDFLKAWLHRHSDHPYPSEDEKKQLCHATGLSMSQVSNWMINARRRILAPVHRAQSANASAGTSGANAPYPPRSAIGPGSSSSLPGSHHLLETRRASMPADTLQLYYPMTLQSVGHGSSSGHGHGGPGHPHSQHHNAHSYGGQNHSGNGHHHLSPSYPHHPSSSSHYTSNGEYLPRSASISGPGGVGGPGSGMLGGPGTMRSASMSHAPPHHSQTHTDGYGRSGSLSLLGLGSSSGLGLPGNGSGTGQGQGGYGGGGSPDGSSPYGA